MKTAKEASRVPALRRWSSEPGFKEGKDHLGLDYCELRPGLAGDDIFTFIVHFFVNKLCHHFNLTVNRPLPISCLDIPVALVDSVDVTLQTSDNQDIARFC
ncbi:MAG: hypothetical protein LBU12_00035 [Deltaproteobacteria bacterium]|jgi:hypothetical protein|nr:hypothetical protein [Deltaproteobacteria bacterium]